MNSLFHGGSSSVAGLKPFNEKPYFPPKSSFLKNGSFFFQRFSQKAHLSFSCTTATSVAALEPFNQKRYFPPKPSFKNPSFFFQRFSQKAHLYFSCTTANRRKPFGKTTTWCCNGGEEEWTEAEEDYYYYGGDYTHVDVDDYGTTGDNYKIVSEDGMKSRYTKIDFAIDTEIQEAIGADFGVDLVAQNVNNIIAFGAKPSTLHLFYSESDILDVGLREKVLKGVEDGCKQSDCVFDGASDFLDYILVENYGLEGYAVGRVRKDLLIIGENIVAGDVLIGLPSSGVHCSGFHLVTRVLAQSGLSLKDQLPGGSGKPITLGEALMVPTVIYVKQVLDIISKGGVKGIAHVTDGGFMKSIPGVFQYCLGLGATIYKDAWEVPAVFKLIQEAGRIEDAKMRRTFNMGIGMVLVVSPDAAARVLGEEHGGYSAYRIGEVTSGEGVTYQ